MRKCHIKEGRRVKIWFGGEMTLWYYRGERLLVVEKIKSAQGNTQGKHLPKAIGWEYKRSGFSWVLTTNSVWRLDLKISRLVCDRAMRALPCFWKDGRQTTGRQTVEKEIWKTSWDQRREIICSSQSVFLRTARQRTFSGDKVLGWHDFPPLLLSINRDTWNK